MCVCGVVCMSDIDNNEAFSVFALRMNGGRNAKRCVSDRPEVDSERETATVEISVYASPHVIITLVQALTLTFTKKKKNNNDDVLWGMRPLDRAQIPH